MARQGRRLCHPGRRGDVRARDPRLLFQYRRAAVVRDRGAVARRGLSADPAPNGGGQAVIGPAEGLLISVSPGETRIALIEDGRLAELWIDRAAGPRRVGDVYRGRFGKVDTGLQGA